MKFKLDTADFRYNDTDKNKLEVLGFKFKRCDKDSPYYGTYKEYIKKDFIPIINLNTLEELLDFTKTYGKLIISEDLIVIYDYYME
jgi:hypothetical protein